MQESLVMAAEGCVRFQLMMEDADQGSLGSDAAILVRKAEEFINIAIAMISGPLSIDEPDTY